MIRGGLYRLARPAIFALDPEAAHRAVLTALAHGLSPRYEENSPRLQSTFLGMTFKNPFAIAAGFDKNAEVVDACLAAGYGFHEVGGVTPRPQPGNPRPRLFRLVDDRALINRLGFNNEGLDAVARRLRGNRGNGVVGANLGANRDTEDKAADFCTLVDGLSDCVDYFTVNVSSPNTPGLRDLQRKEALESLLTRVFEARERAGKRRPILVKIAPDLDEPEFEDIISVVRALGVDGLVVSNTTISRTGLKTTSLVQESGGLSGAPLFRRSTALLAKARLALGPDYPLIGVGGVSSPETAYAKILAGANLVQFYTGLVYEGPDLLGEIKTGVAQALAKDGFTSISAAVGRDAKRWASDSDR